MATLVSVRFSPAACVVSRKPLKQTTEKIKVLQSEYHANAHKNFGKVVLVICTSDEARTFWMEKIKKSVVYFGFKNLLERDIKDGQIESSLDGVDLSNLYAILEVGDKAPGIMKEYMGEDLKHKVVMISLPGGMPDQDSYSCELWPEKLAREQLIDEIFEWSKSEQKNEETLNPNWLPKAQQLCSIDDLQQNSSKRLCVVYNPVSGLRNTKKHIDEVALPLLRVLGFKHFDLHETKYVGHCEKLVAELDLTKYDAILSFGGDGTHGMTFRGLYKNKSYKSGHDGSLDFPFGVMPTGSGCWVWSNLDEAVTPLETPGGRMIVASSLRVAGSETIKFPLVEYEAEDFDGKKKRGVSGCVGLFGNICIMIKISDAIREVDNTLGMMRYTVATCINLLKLETLDIRVRYIPHDSDEEIPDLDNWKVNNNWVVFDGEVMDILIWDFTMTPHPKGNKTEMQTNYFQFGVILPMNREEYAAQNFLERDGPTIWEKFENPPEKCKYWKVKALEITFPDLEKNDQWLASLNVDGEPGGNIKNFRAAKGKTNARLFDHLPQQQRDLVQFCN